MGVVDDPGQDGHAVEVSVVVATYNTGDALAAMVDSVRRQSIGPTSVELVLVDDGSTDGTGERIEALATIEPWIRARHIPNSGWPSRPRNVGLSLARGEFVMIMDHDDELFPEALERMAAAGRRDGADMILGKEVRSGARTAGLDTFRRNVTGARVIEDDLLTMLTPHRMFRRAFLEQHDLRFSERVRRLEDHELIARAFVHAPSVTVVADRPCYRWMMHDSNNSLRLPDPDEYYAALRLTLDAVDRWPYGHDTRERAMAVWLRTTVLDRFGPSGFGTWPRDYQPGFFAAARSVTLERLPKRLDALLPAAYRVRAALLRAGDMEGLLAYTGADGTVTTRPVVTAADPRDGGLSLEVEAVLEVPSGPVRFERRGDRVHQLPSGPLDPAVAEQALDVTDELAAARVDLLLTERSTNAEWFLPTEAGLDLAESGGGLVAVVRARALLEPQTALLGHPVTPGVWDLRLRTLALGYDSRPKLRPGAVPPPHAWRSGDLSLEPYLTRGDRLALQVGTAGTVRPGPSTVTTAAASGARARRGRAARALRRVLARGRRARR